MDLSIVLFASSKHNRDDFDCEDEELNQYIRGYASQDVKRGLAKVFVLASPTDNIVKGYYSLNSASCDKKQLRKEESKKLPAYPIPGVLIGRLAIDKSVKGQGYGADLLMDALERVYQASQTTMGIYAVFVEAKNEAAKKFYEKYGFRTFIGQPLKLYLPMKAVEKLILGT